MHKKGSIRGGWLSALLVGLMLFSLSAQHDHAQEAEDVCSHCCAHEDSTPTNSAPVDDEGCGICDFLHTLNTSALACTQITLAWIQSSEQVVLEPLLPDAHPLRLSVSSRAPPARG